MDAETFDRIVDTVLENTRNTLVVKAKEYATEDRLHNFKIAGGLEGCTPDQALGGMMAKHTVSIYDMIRTHKPFPREVWDEKIGDHINYLILLRAIVEEQWLELESQKVQGLAVDEDAELQRLRERLADRRSRYNPGPKNTAEGIVLADREAAENVLEALNKLIVTDKKASVYDLYELVGITGTFTDQDWGWFDFNGAEIKRVYNGFLLNLPKPKYLHDDLPVLNPLAREADEHKAEQDKTALNDIAAHLAKLSKPGRSFRKTDLNEIFNIVEKVRVVEPEFEPEISDAQAIKELFDLLSRQGVHLETNDIFTIVQSATNEKVPPRLAIDQIEDLVRNAKVPWPTTISDIWTVIRKVRDVHNEFGTRVINTN